MGMIHAACITSVPIDIAPNQATIAITTAPPTPIAAMPQFIAAPGACVERSGPAEGVGFQGRLKHGRRPYTFAANHAQSCPGFRHYAPCVSTCAMTLLNHAYRKGDKP